MRSCFCAGFDSYLCTRLCVLLVSWHGRMGAREAGRVGARVFCRVSWLVTGFVGARIGGHVCVRVGALGVFCVGAHADWRVAGQMVGHVGARLARRVRTPTARYTSGRHKPEGRGSIYASVNSPTSGSWWRGAARGCDAWPLCVAVAAAVSLCVVELLS